jgi:lipoate-protein ligase A
VTGRPLFDADAIRSLDRRTVFVRAVERPTLVLGSTQDAGIVDTGALARRGLELVRRRSGGGAVLLEPERAVWIDTWVPRADPLWSDDVVHSGSWVGSWWAESLGDPRLDVHQGPPIASRWSDRICFAGVAAGEVVYAGRKLVGVAQWRTRSGALTHSLAYLGIEWDRMTELLGLGAEGGAAARELTASTATLHEVVPADSAGLARLLIEHLPEPESWELGAAGG